MVNIPARSFHTASGADIDSLPVAEGPCVTRVLPPPRTVRDNVPGQLDAGPLDERRRQGRRQDF